MERVFDEWLSTGATSTVAKRLKLNYTIYGRMLLLPANAFESPPWLEVKFVKPNEDFDRLYQLICKHFKVTHIAINQPIPASEVNRESENVIRAPINFTPLHGDFGPTTCSSPPSKEDFESAFWVTAKQNNIYQTWAPRWTMFSRGNIGEKARLISLPLVVEAVREGEATGKGCTAIDLYAGIGYFAFSYLKAGVTKILCWDLNPWSIEGLKRGAAANKWSTMTYLTGHSDEDLKDADAEMLLFNEKNDNATDRVRQLRHHLPPVRHVNCGLLPTSRGSWQTALNVLDPAMPGWVHVHENFAIKEIEGKVEEVRSTFQEMVDVISANTIVEIEHINRLKSYAPGVMHCVVDIYIAPLEPG